MLGLDAPQRSLHPARRHLEPSAAAIGSVNTIVNDDGVLTASNTDYLAIDELIADHNVDLTRPVILHGSGGMAKAIAAVLQARGADQVTVLSRNAGTRGRSRPSVRVRRGIRPAAPQSDAHQRDAPRHERRTPDA